MSMKEQEIGQQIQGFIIIKTIGEGRFSKVKLGIHKLTGLNVAIKIFIKQTILERKGQQRVKREIQIIKKVRHPYVIQLYQIKETPQNFYLIMEYAQKGDLFHQINMKQQITQLEAQQHFAQLIIGLEYLHSVGVAHRDLKPQNILLSSQGIKICDFGLANFYQEHMLLSTACGSPCYAPPQVLNTLNYDPQKVDIWSCGIILYAMLLGYLPFEHENTSILYAKIKVKDVPQMPSRLSTQCKSIIQSMLRKDPQKRPTIKQLKNDQWIKSECELIKDVKFEISQQIVEEVCLKYQTSQKQEMIDSLTRNEHNYLTTTYYLTQKAIQKSANNRIIQPTFINSTISFRNLIQQDEDLNSDEQQHNITNKQPNIQIDHNPLTSQKYPIDQNQKQILTTSSKNTSTHEQIKLNNKKSTQNSNDIPYMVTQFNQENKNLTLQKIQKFQKVQPRKKLKKIDNMIQNVINESEINQSSKIKSNQRNSRNQQIIIYGSPMNNKTKVPMLCQYQQQKDKSLIKKQILLISMILKKQCLLALQNLNNHYNKMNIMHKQCIYITGCLRSNKPIQIIISQLNQT